MEQRAEDRVTIAMPFDQLVPAIDERVRGGPRGEQVEVRQISRAPARQLQQEQVLDARRPELEIGDRRSCVLPTSQSRQPRRREAVDAEERRDRHGRPACHRGWSKKIRNLATLSWASILSARRAVPPS
jgi:hypothetical protein